MAFADEVRAERARRDWTQEELAAAAGISRATVTRIERGDTVSLDVVGSVGRALGIDLGALTLADLVGPRLQSGSSR